MIVTWNQIKNKVYFYFKAEDADLVSEQKTISGRSFYMRNNKCYFEVPSNFLIEETHPDIIAATAIYIVEPFVGERISFQENVSRGFAEKYKELTKKEIVSVSDDVKPRTTSEKLKTSLAFSGGVDSTAAAMILPKNSPLIFVERDDSKIEKKGLYKKEAAVYACEQLEKFGHEVYRVKTDYEFVREPVGFSLSISSGAASLLLADYTSSQNIGYGMVLESAFGIGDVDFTHPSGVWFKLVEAAGIGTYVPTAGLSEVATSIVVNSNSQYKNIAQSCIRGDIQNSCGKCMKCFRKSMLDTVINHGNLDDIDPYRCLSLKEVQMAMRSIPLHHENVYQYITQDYKGKNAFYKKLKKKTLAEKERIEWPAKWYPGSNLFIPENLQTIHLERISKFLEVMSDSEASQLENWHRKSLSSSKSVKGLVYRWRHRQFLRVLDNNQG